MEDIKCRICGRQIKSGEDAWASEWTVVDVSGTSAVQRVETRFACMDCEAA